MYKNTSRSGGNISKGQRSFAKSPAPSVPRSVFNRDSQLMTGIKAGDIVPCFRDEVTPGDTINMDARFFGRLEPTIKPLMSGMYVDVFFFAVPHRLVWENWQRMHGEQDDPGDSTDFLAPVVTTPPAGGFGLESVYDYMGVPPDQPIPNVSALWFRAYHLIWNEWFRDQTIDDSVAVPKGDGPDAYTAYALQRRAKRHDYFTSANPFVQKGSPVELPLGGFAPVVPATSSQGLGVPTFNVGGTNSTLRSTGVDSVLDAQWSSVGGAPPYVASFDETGLQTDLSAASAATVNELREAIALQQVLEKDARGGTRYTEMIRAHFGVQSDDARLQRPELLGVGTLTVNPQVVANTAVFSGPLGQIGAFSTFEGGVRFTRSFTEHAMVIGLMCLRGDIIYQQGLHRDFSRRDRYDWPLPGLAHLGEQPILSKEIYADGSAGDDDVFGYQERYAERRYKPSEVTGVMRSSAGPLSQDYYHTGQDFGVRPVLDRPFIQENPPMSRLLAVPDDIQVLVNAWFQYRHAQPLPVYGVPGLNRL